jgi:Protein of unknown function (DUF3800)
VYIFFDESGDFSWAPPRPSVFAALIVLNRDMPKIHTRFALWKSEIVGDSRSEVKGKDLTDLQLRSFVSSVFSESDKNSRLLFVGVDTRVTSQDVVLAAKEQTAKLFARAHSIVLEVNPTNKRLAQDYLEMPGWIRGRSSQNFLWIAALEEALSQSVRLAVVNFAAEEFDDEFANIEIEIDASFVKEKRHVTFWKEWFRNGFVNRKHRSQHFLRPAAWRARDHPFLKKYGRGEYLDFTDLFWEHLHFKNSKDEVGIQIVDICARIALRFLNGEESLEAFSLLLPRIIEQDGAAIRMVHFDPDHSLWNDSIENHVRMRSNT